MVWTHNPGIKNEWWCEVTIPTSSISNGVKSQSRHQIWAMVWAHNPNVKYEQCGMKWESQHQNPCQSLPSVSSSHSILTQWIPLFSDGVPFPLPDFHKKHYKSSKQHKNNQSNAINQSNTNHQKKTNNQNNTNIHDNTNDQQKLLQANSKYIQPQYKWSMETSTQ